MNINYHFLPQGAKIIVTDDTFEYSAFNNTQKWSRNNTLILDTGNLLIPGVVDHHQPSPEVAESCVTSLIVERAPEFLGHLKQQETLNIITHFVPDLDATASVYFAIKYLEGKVFGEKEQLIADYVLEVDSGKLSIDPENPVGIASIWLAVTDEKTNKKPWERDNKSLLERGIAFFDEILNTLNHVPNPKQHDFGIKLNGFESEKNKILEDIDVYNTDLKDRSVIHTVELLNIKDGGTEFVDAIFTNKPQSFLWKYWVRGDRKNSSLGQGFILTCAHWESRSIISVDPNTSYNLKGLGILIDRVEVDKLLKIHSEDDIILGFLNAEQVRPGIRPGFHRNDPWYDGRGFQNFTIIDAPRAGTLLSIDEIEKLIINVPLWQYYAENLSINGENNLSLNDLLMLPSPIFELTDPLDNLALPDSFTERELNPEFQKIFLSVFFNAKSFSRAELLQQLWFKNLEDRYVKLLANALNSLDNENFYQLKEQYSALICENLEAKSVITFLENVSGLTKPGFDICIKKIRNFIHREDLLSFYFKLQQLHPQAFYYDAQTENLQLEPVQRFLMSTPNSSELKFELPLYAFNNLKNYFDDILTARHDFAEDLKSFIATDYNSLFDETGISGLLDNLKTKFKAYKSEILKNYFGNNYEIIKEKRNKLIYQLKGIQAKKIKQYSTEELLTLDFETYSEIILVLGNHSNESVAAFRQIIGFLQNLSALENLFQRLAGFSKLKDESFKSFFEDYAYYSLLNDITYDLFYTQSTYLQSSKSDDIEPNLKNILNQFNIIKTIHDPKNSVDLSELTDLSSRFILNLISEFSMPFEDPEQVLDSSLSQYYLICGAGGILDNLQKLPYFYQQLWADIFTGYKRFYAEKITFLREQMIRLTELTDSAEETKASTAFDVLYVELINESVKYDWQELKDYVDSGKFDSHRFYQKYFYWKKLNNNKTVQFEELSKYNSKFRFAVGNVKTFNETLIHSIPANNSEKSDTESLKKIFLDQNYNQIITHLPNNFLHQCFDYISKLYINRFDVDTAQKGLFSYSSRFPWYYTLFTKTNFIRFLTLFLVFMLFLAGIFDNNTYKVEEITENAPCALFAKKMLGESLFNVFHYFSSGFWMLLLSLTFVLPFVILLIVFRNLIFKKKSKNGIQLKFLELIESIEANNGNLLYLSFIIPLLFVVLQMTNSDTIGMINNITGIRLASTFLIVLGLTLAAVFSHVREKNKYKGLTWTMRRTEHMFWLHLLQAMIICIFIIDILLRLEISLDNFETHDALFTLGISKFIRFEIGPFDFIVMPVFTVMVSLLTLFFSFFIDKVLGNKE